MENYNTCSKDTANILRKKRGGGNVSEQRGGSDRAHFPTARFADFTSAISTEKCPCLADDPQLSKVALSSLFTVQEDIKRNRRV